MPLRFGTYRELASSVAERLAAAPDTAVLVASGGVANAITREVLRRVPNGVATLTLRTIETFARGVINDAGEYPRVAGDDERRLAMRTAIRSFNDPLFDSRGIASMLERSYRDVRDGGLTLAEFEQRVRGAGALRNRARTQLLIRAWPAYEKLIAQSGAIDPADLLARAAELIAGGAKVAPQIVAGFYDMTGAQLRIVDVLAERDKLLEVLIPSAEGDAYNFAVPFAQHFSALSTQHSALLHVKAPTINIAQFDTKTIELREVCREIRELLDRGVPARDTGVVARTLEPYDLRLLQRFASEFGFAISADEEIALTAHRVGRAVSTILKLRERGFPRGEVIEVVRDGFQPSRRMAIDDVDVATRRARIAGGSSDDLRAVPRRAHIDDYLALVAELEALSPAAPLDAKSAAALLENIVNRIRLETKQDVAAAEAIESVARLFRTAAPWKTTFDVHTIVDTLEQQTLKGAATGNRQPATIFVGDVMRFRGRSFEHLFAVRMQDEVFPQRRVDDPLLPDHDRRELVLREIGDGRDEERMLFQLLLDAAGTSLSFTFAGGDGFGKTLRPSPLVKQLAIAREPERRAELLRDFGRLFARAATPREAKAPSTRQLQLVARAGTQSVFDGYLFASADHPELRAKLAASLQSASPTQLEDFGECPQKFFLKHILGVRDVDDPEHELQLHHREKGKLDHGILERFYRDLREWDYQRAAVALPQLDSLLRARLDELIDEAFDAVEADAPPFNRAMRDIERRSTKRVLAEFLAADLADLHQSDLRPREFEYKFGPKWRERKQTPAHDEAFIVEAGDAVIRVEGSIDRIDVAGDRLRIVDYKSGKALRHRDLPKKIDRGVRLQLALYAMAAARFFDAPPENVSGTIKPLVISEESGSGGKFLFALHEHAATLRETLQLFARSIAEGRFPAFPNEKDTEFNSCKYCPVSHSCRTKHDAAERYAVLQLKDPRTLLGNAR
jgi:superfamily I DNA/RNA helicase